MAKLLLSFCIICSVSALQAQISPVAPRLANQSYGFKSKLMPHLSVGGSSLTHSFTGIRKGGNIHKSTIDNMPVAGEGEVILTPRGDNIIGFNIYTAIPDNMTVLKPDSTFYSVMPNAFNTLTVKPVEKR